MAYCTPSDVVALAPQLTIDASSKPNTGQVVSMIGDVEQEVEAILGNLGYVVPITGTSSLRIVKSKAAHGVLAMVLRARAFAVSEPKAQGADEAEQVYRAWLKALASATDPTELPDAPRTDEAPEKNASAHHGTAAGFDASADAPVSLGMTF